MNRLNYVLALVVSLFLFSCQSTDTQSQEQKQELSTSEKGKAVSLTTDEWYAMYKEKPGVMLDVRTPGEFQQGYIEGAELIDVTSSDFYSSLEALSLPKDSPVYVYCRSGSRSKKAMSILQSQGFTEIYELNTGIMGWQQAGLPVTK
jgi:rhodanese-related sulfurtransferase